MRSGLAMALVVAALMTQQDRALLMRGEQTRPSVEQLTGAWRLVSIETIRPNGDVIYPFYGKHPEGLLIYDRSGWMAVQIVSDPKPMKPNTDSREKFLAATAQDKAAAADGYYAYFGKWELNFTVNAVIHHIEQSLFPGERGETAVRQVMLANNRLTLSTKTNEMGENHIRRLAWERLK